MTIGDDGVEHGGVVHREQQERQPAVTQGGQRVFGIPDRVGQADQHVLAGTDEGAGAEHGIAQPTGLVLHDVHHVCGFAIGAGHGRSVVPHQVRFGR